VDFLQAISTLLSLTAFGLIGAIAVKAFQISGDLGEIKDLLRDIRRNSEDNSPAGLRAAAKSSQEAILRELDDEAYASIVQQQTAQTSPGLLARAVSAESQSPEPTLEPDVLSDPRHNRRP
jgi:hypothetical protein